MEVKTHINNTLATAKRWPRPLNRGGRTTDYTLESGHLMEGGRLIEVRLYMGLVINPIIQGLTPRPSRYEISPNHFVIAHRVSRVILFPGAAWPSSPAGAGMAQRGAGMARWWERSPPTNVSRVRFPDPASDELSYVGWVCCWFSSLLRQVFLWVLRFSPLLKNQHFQIPIRSRLLSSTLL